MAPLNTCRRRFVSGDYGMWSICFWRTQPRGGRHLLTACWLQDPTGLFVTSLFTFFAHSVSLIIFITALYPPRLLSDCLSPTFRLSVSSSACHCILSCSPHGTLCNSLYSVPLSLPLCCLYSSPLSVLIICYGTLILQGNSHWFPFLSCPALICYATAVPLTRLIGHCPLSFQLPSLLLPFSLNLVPLHHPPPVVWSYTLAVRDLLLTTMSEWGVFHLQSLYQSRTPAACIIGRMHESIGVSFVHIFAQRELFSWC